MRRMTKEEIQEELSLHKKWLQKDIAGSQANFQEANLTGYNFYRLDLTEAIFYGADLTDTAWHGCILDKADFTRAKLDGANFVGAYETHTAITGGVTLTDVRSWPSPEVVDSMGRKAMKVHPIPQQKALPTKPVPQTTFDKDVQIGFLEFEIERLNQELDAMGCKWKEAHDALIEAKAEIEDLMQQII